jgi:hypothetical protein
MVGFGTGYREGPTRGIEAGREILNSRYDQAQQQQQQRLRSDEMALSNFNNEDRLGQEGFRDQALSFEDAVRGRGQQDQEAQNQWDRGFRTNQAQQQQKNADRNFNQRAQDGATRNQQWQQEFGEKKADDQRNYSLNSRRVGIEQQRASLESQHAQRVASGNSAGQLRGRQQAVTLNEKRQQDYDALENGNPAKGIDGYRDQLKTLQTAKVNPDTGQEYTPKERQQAIAELNAQHVAEKNQIEQNYAANMGQLGFQVQPVQYGPDDQVIGQQQPQQPAAAPPQQPQQQPRFIKTQKTGNEVRIGQTVLVGTRLAKITGVNQKTGRPIVSYVSGGH